MKENFDDFLGDISLEKTGPQMPAGCKCYEGKPLSRDCLTCASRVRAQAKLAREHNVPESEVVDVINESGFCTKCNEVKPLRGSSPAPYTGDSEAESQRHITCADCCLTNDEHGC